MDDVNKKQTLTPIYNNVSNNANFLINNFFTPDNMDLARTYFDDAYIEERISKGKINIPVEFISNKINMTKQSVYHTINGQSNPALEKVVALSNFFNIPINDFIYKDLRSLTVNNINYFSTDATTNYVLNDSTETLINSIDDKLKILSQTELEEVLNFVLNLQKNDNEITYK